MPAQRRNRQGVLTRVAVLDLTTIPGDRLPHDVSALTDPALRGTTVTLRLGTLTPVDVDPRVPALLRDALAAGVDIDLEADPWQLTAWSRAIGNAQAPARHLRAVRPS